LEARHGNTLDKRYLSVGNSVRKPKQKRPIKAQAILRSKNRKEEW
jgi:hypothetical protein